MWMAVKACRYDRLEHTAPMKVFTHLDDALRLNEEETLLLDSVRALARDKLAPRAEAYDRSSEFPWDNVEDINALGLNTPCSSRKPMAGQPCPTASISPVCGKFPKLAPRPGAPRDKSLVARRHAKVSSAWDPICQIDRAPHGAGQGKHRWLAFVRVSPDTKFRAARDSHPVHVLSLYPIRAPP